MHTFRKEELWSSEVGPDTGDSSERLSHNSFEIS